MNIIRVGVDIAKSVFHVRGVGRHDKTQWQGKYARQKWLDALSRNWYKSLCFVSLLGSEAPEARLLRQVDCGPVR